ncbi:hypothetical protein [Streptomyces roseolilacinus]|uniref:Lipoprotein n=1 Tax=Streptomyces roseolilacinus TaxID=66904 RepID=A0A918EKY8_9ACTN|nr:hypothetical protein [Streptomyces roseolilacinus]GGQ09218.1 hypothetical protein GCM10010249_29650 [Streptomyces roseolilacinus]
MRTHRLVPVVLTAALALAGCVSVRGGPPAPPPVPGESPARDRPPVRVAASPPPTPPAPREELSGRAPVLPAATPRRTAGVRSDVPAGAAPRRLGTEGRRADPPGPGRRPAAGEPKRRGPGRTPPVVVPRPGPRQTVRMRDLCQAARGTVDRSVVGLCRRAYG